MLLGYGVVRGVLLWMGMGRRIGWIARGVMGKGRGRGRGICSYIFVELEFRAFFWPGT